MEATNKDLSLLFYDYLCKVVGSEDVVKTRRRIFNALDFVSKYTKSRTTVLMSGSKAEGLDLEGSDLDIMYVLDSFSVYENMQELEGNKNRRSTVPVVMDTENTKPGFTQLKVNRKSMIDEVLSELCVGDGDDVYISSKLFREYFLTAHGYEGDIIHGPCMSDSEGMFDHAFCFRCKQWITHARQWINRPRGSWPKNDLVDTIVEYGVLFVPIGCKNSPNEDLEFRISFSVAEKILIHSFNHVQFLCYALLKITSKELIKPNHQDLLCSYFLKTIMFWMLEESPKSDWKPRNLLNCFELCLKRLVYYVTYETCLHYFIQENNLFENRFNQSEHEALLDTLQRLYSRGWQCVLQTKTLQSFRYMMQPSPNVLVPSVSALPCTSYNHFPTHLECHVMYRTIFGSQYLPGKQMYTLLSSKSNQILGQEAVVFTSNSMNKESYKIYRERLSHLLIATHYDAVSGWLLLASLFYTRKQYIQCLHILDYCLNKCTPDKILLTLGMSADSQHTFNREMGIFMRNQFLRSFRTCVADFVVFVTSDIRPKELSEVDIHTFILPVLFAHFLKFLSLHRLNQTAEKMNSLRDLKSTFKEIYFIPNNDFKVTLANKFISIAEQLLSE